MLPYVRKIATIESEPMRPPEPEARSGWDLAHAAFAPGIIPIMAPKTASVLSGKGKPRERNTAWPGPAVVPCVREALASRLNH